LHLIWRNFSAAIIPRLSKTLFRFSADIQINAGQVDVEIPILTRLPDVSLKQTGKLPKL
jgi:hypothetical protein